MKNTVCTGTTCKDQETFAFKGVRLERFRRPENNVRWLAPSNIFQMGAVIRDLCAHTDEYSNLPTK